jgi:hypothetical protein
MAVLLPDLLSEKVSVLLWSKGIYLASPERKLAACNLLIYLERNIIDHPACLTAYAVTVIRKILSAESLDSE